MGIKQLVGLPQGYGGIGIVDDSPTAAELTTHSLSASDVHGLLPTTSSAMDIYIDGVSGLDTNTGLTKLVPLKTISGYFYRYGLQRAQGSSHRVHIAGTGGADPWETPTATTPQQYLIDSIDLGSGQVYGNNLVFRGPQMIRPVLAAGSAYQPSTGLGWPLKAATVAVRCDASGVADPAGLFTRLDPDTTLGEWVNWTANALCGYFVRLKRGTNLRFFEMPISSNTTTGIIVPSINIVGELLATDLLEIVTPGVHLRGSASNSNIRAIAIHGYGSDVPATSLATDGGCTFERLLMEMPVVMAQAVSFDRCRFDEPGANGALINRLGSVAMVRCLAYGAVYWNGWDSSARVGYSRPDSATSPNSMNASLVVISLVSNYGSIYVGGNSGGVGGTGVFVPQNGLVINEGSGDALTVGGQGSYFEHVRFTTLAGTSSGGVGILAVNGGTARIWGGADVELTGVSGDLQVEGMAVVSYGSGVGEFEEVAGYNGNLHNTTIVAGVPTGNFSRIYKP